MGGSKPYTVWAWRKPTATQPPCAPRKAIRIPTVVTEAVREALAPGDVDKLEQHMKNGGTIYVSIFLS